MGPGNEATANTNTILHSTPQHVIKQVLMRTEWYHGHVVLLVYQKVIDVLFIPAFVSVSDFVLAPPILVPRLDTSVDPTLLLCEGMTYFS